MINKAAVWINKNLILPITTSTWESYLPRTSRRWLCVKMSKGASATKFSFEETMKALGEKINPNYNYPVLKLAIVDKEHRQVKLYFEGYAPSLQGRYLQSKKNTPPFIIVEKSALRKLMIEVQDLVISGSSQPKHIVAVKKTKKESKLEQNFWNNF